MTRMGMDVDVVEGIGRQLKGQAQQISGVISQIESLVNQAVSHWDGKDAHDFRSLWSGEHKPKMFNLQHMIEDLGNAALNNVNEQRQVSVE